MRAMRTFGIGVVCLVVLATVLSGCSRSPDTGTPVDVSTLDQFTQALVYARSGDVANLEAIIAGNNDIVFERGRNGMSLLHYAAISSQPETVKLLLDKGADIYAVSDDDMTPLEAAESEGANELVLQLLLDAGGT